MLIILQLLSNDKKCCTRVETRVNVCVCDEIVCLKNRIRLKPIFKNVNTFKL